MPNSISRIFDSQDDAPVMPGLSMSEAIGQFARNYRIGRVAQRDDTPVRQHEEPNVYDTGQKLLVKAFNYGTGFEVVNQVEDLGENYTFYEVKIMRKIDHSDMPLYTAPDLSSYDSVFIPNGISLDASQFRAIRSNGLIVDEHIDGMSTTSF